MAKFLSETGLQTVWSKIDSLFLRKTSVDSVPTANSTNPISSGGMYSVLEEIEDTVAASENALNTRVTTLENNTITGSGLTADKLVLGNGGRTVKTSTYGVTTTSPSSSSDNTTIPTSKAVWDAFGSVASALKYKGTIGTGGTVTALPATHAVGDVYVVKTAATYANKACEVGDYIVCNTAGTTANDAHWDVLNGENQVENKSASLAAAGSSATIATVDGTNLTITTPSGWTGVDKTGTITKVGNTTSGEVSVTSAGATIGTSLTTIGTVGGVNIQAKIGSYAASDHNHNSTYVKLDAGANEQTIKSSIGTLSKGVINLWRSSGNHYTFLGFSNGTTETYLGGIGIKSQEDHNLYRKDGSNYYKIWDENNFTVSSAGATIGTSDTTIATIGGVAIKAKIGSYASSSHTHYIGTTQVQSSSAAQNLTGIGTVAGTGIYTITSASGANLGFKETRTGGASVSLGVGTGNTNHGVYSHSLEKWLIYASSTDTTDKKVYVNGTSIPANATLLTAHQTIKQNGITGATRNCYAACSTAAATAAKTADVTSGTVTLEAGLKVSVKFANANTADSPTLNINSKGAKNIFHKGTQITTGSNKGLLAGIVDFVYDGTQWHLVGNYIDSNSGGTVTSVTPGTGLRNGTATTAITTSGTLNLITAATGEIGGIKASNVLTSAVTLTSGNGSTASRYYGVQVDNAGKAFVNIPWTDTNTKVTQTVTASSNTSFRPLLLGYSYSDATVFAPATTTDTTYATHLAKFKPSTGELYVVGLRKLGTDGKVVTGSDTTVWNTNGGTTSNILTGSNYNSSTYADTTPTQNSTKLITSGGIYSALDEIESVVAASEDALNTRVTTLENNTVTGSGLTANTIILGNGTRTVKTSSKTISTTAPSSSSDDTTIPTSKAVNSAISASAYTHPTYSAQSAGLYRVGRDATGHVVIGSSFTIPTVTDIRFADYTGESTTAASTAAKTTTSNSKTLAAADLVTGLCAIIYHQYANSGSNATLNVGGSGAKAAYNAAGTRISGSTGTWTAGDIIRWVYDSTLNSNSGGWKISAILGNGSTHRLRLLTGRSPLYSYTETYQGTVTSITPGTGLRNGTATTAITSSGTLNLIQATTGELGGIKLAVAARASEISVTTGGTTADRYYGVELDSTGKAFVNVPWEAGTSVTVSNKAATIGTSLTTIATVAGTNITAKIGSYASSSHEHAFSAITSKPTTVSGYGITDATTGLKISTIAGNVNTSTRVFTTDNLKNESGTEITFSPSSGTATINAIPMMRRDAEWGDWVYHWERTNSKGETGIIYKAGNGDIGEQAVVGITHFQNIMTFAAADSYTAGTVNTGRMAASFYGSASSNPGTKSCDFYIQCKAYDSSDSWKNFVNFQFSDNGIYKYFPSDCPNSNLVNTGYWILDESMALSTSEIDTILANAT